MVYRPAYFTLLCFFVWWQAIPRMVLAESPDSLCLASGVENDGSCGEFEKGWKASMCLQSSSDFNVPLLRERSPMLRILLESETWQDLVEGALGHPMLESIFGHKVIPIQETFDVFDAFAVQLETLPLLHRPLVDALKGLVERLGDNRCMFILHLLTREAREGIGNAVFASEEIRASVALQWVANILLQYQSQATSANIDPTFLHQISKRITVLAYAVDYVVEKSKSAGGNVYRKVIEDAAEQQGLFAVKEMVRDHLTNGLFEAARVTPIQSWKQILALSAYSLNPKSKPNIIQGIRITNPAIVLTSILERLDSSVTDPSVSTVTKTDFYNAVNLELNNVVDDARVYAEYWKDAKNNRLFGGLKYPEKVIEKWNDLMRLSSASNKKLRKMVDFLESSAVFIQKTLTAFPYMELNKIGIATPSTTIYPIIFSVTNDILEFAKEFKNAEEPTISSYGMVALLKRLEEKSTRIMTDGGINVSIRNFGFVGEILDKFLTPGMNNYCMVSIESIKEALGKIDPNFATFPSFLQLFVTFYGFKVNLKSKALVEEVIAQESEMTKLYCNYINRNNGKGVGLIEGVSSALDLNGDGDLDFVDMLSIGRSLPAPFHLKRMRSSEFLKVKNPFRNILSSLEHNWETKSSRLFKSYLRNALQIVDLDLARNAFTESLIEKLVRGSLCEFITLIARQNALHTEALNVFGRKSNSLHFRRLDWRTQIMLFLATQPEMRNDVSRFGRSIGLDKKSISEGAPYALKAAVDFGQEENVKFLLSSIDSTSTVGPKYVRNDWHFCNIEKFPSRVKGSIEYVGTIKIIETACEAQRNFEFGVEAVISFFVFIVVVVKCCK